MRAQFRSLSLHSKPKTFVRLESSQVSVFTYNRRQPMTTASSHLPKIGFSIREACHATSLGRTTIYNHIAAGRLRAVRVGGRTIIPADALRALIEGMA